MPAESSRDRRRCGTETYRCPFRGPSPALAHKAAGQQTVSGETPRSRRLGMGQSSSKKTPGLPSSQVCGGQKGHGVSQHPSSIRPLPVRWGRTTLQVAGEPPSVDTAGRFCLTDSGAGGRTLGRFQLVTHSMVPGGCQVRALTPDRHTSSGSNRTKRSQSCKTSKCALCLWTRPRSEQCR